MNTLLGGIFSSEMEIWSHNNLNDLTRGTRHMGAETRHSPCWQMPGLPPIFSGQQAESRNGMHCQQSMNALNAKYAPVGHMPLKQFYPY